MNSRLYKAAVLGVVGVLLLAVPAASEEDRPEDEPPTVEGDDDENDDVSTQGTSFDDFVSIENPSGTGQSRLNLTSSDSAIDDNSWRLKNNASENHRLEFAARDSGSDVLHGVWEQTSGDLGLGTANPGNKLHIDDTGGFQVNLSDGTNDYIQDAFGSFRIGLSGVSTNQFRLFGNDAPPHALVVRDRIGVGTQNPATDVDIRNIDGSSHTTYRLANGSDVWDNSVRSFGHFAFAKAGTGGNEFLVRDRFHPTATLDVEGPVRATEFKTTSSQEYKTDVQDIDSQKVLEKLNELDVKSWRFQECNDGEGRLAPGLNEQAGDAGKAVGDAAPDQPGQGQAAAEAAEPAARPCTGEASGPPHIGPMAEDFQQVFDLGDGEGQSISTVDADGVMMAAIQALNDKLEAKDATVEELENKVDDLEQRLEALEKQSD